MDTKPPIHADLCAAYDLIYNQSGYNYTSPVQELESSEYGACSFDLNGLKVRFRVAKITPTKVGQFVTLWKRIGSGPIQPFDEADPIDLVVISVRQGRNFGQFIFSKNVLCEQAVLSRGSKEGKRAIRVYPPWDQTTSKQAQKTQDWQLKHFLELPHGRGLDKARCRKLYISHDLV